MKPTQDVFSSVVIYGVRPHEFTEVSDHFKDLRLRFSFATNIIDLKNLVNSTPHLISIVVRWDQYCSEEEVFFRPFRSQLIILEGIESEALKGSCFIANDPNQVTNQLQIQLNQQIHPDLANWMKQCASFLMPFHLTQGAITFLESEFETTEDFRYYKMTLELAPFSGYMLMGVDFSRFQKEIAAQLGLDQFLIEDFLLELLNQFAGILTRPFFNHFENPRVLSPTRLGGNIKESLPKELHLPFSSIKDETNLFQFHLAIIHIKGGGPFKASMESAWDPVQSLEFL